MGREFNREMQQYLKTRRTASKTNPFLAARRYFQGLFAKEEEPKPLDIPPEQVQAVLEQSATRRPTGVRNTPLAAPSRTRSEQARSAPTQPKVKKMGWFSKAKDEDEEMMDATPQQPVLDEDVKEVLKITFKWLKRMDPDTIDEIKASPDFEKYKQVLDKYGLIKK
jgi:hypothetical protein